MFQVSQSVRGDFGLALAMIELVDYVAGQPGHREPEGDHADLPGPPVAEFLLVDRQRDHQ